RRARSRCHLVVGGGGHGDCPKAPAQARTHATKCHGAFVNAEMPPLRRREFPLTWFLRLAVSAAVLVAIFRIVPIEQIWREAQQISPMLWCSALAIFLAGH